MAHRLLDRVAFAENHLRALDQVASGRRRMRLFAEALDQLDAPTGLELADLQADRRWRVSDAFQPGARVTP
jgi:hypothetical protein